MPAFARMTCNAEVSGYFTAEKRLSNELAGTIGAEPATRLSLPGAAAAVAGGVSEIVGFSGGCAVACLVSAVFGAETFGGWGSFRLVSMTFGLAAVASALEVVSAPPRPTLRARLLKNPSDCPAPPRRRAWRALAPAPWGPPAAHPEL